MKRLVEELVEEGYPAAADWSEALLVELAYALRPEAHERHIPSYGSIVEPDGEPADWDRATELHTTVRSIDGLSVPDARRFADGLSSWLLRADCGAELAVFDRPAGSERDLVVLAGATGGTLVQRHPNGSVRVVGSFGVLRWNGVAWHHERPTSSWISAVSDEPMFGDPKVRTRLIEFAVHDLGARGIGSILVYRPDDGEPPGLPAPGSPGAYQRRLATPPPLDIHRPSDLAPLRHVLTQVDGASMFDGAGVLRHLGVRLVPSAAAESDVEGFRGMRHTSGRRYSFDEPRATVIVVSEDGPVTVLRGGVLLGRSEGD